MIVEPLPEEQGSPTPEVNAPLQEPNVSQEQDKSAVTEVPHAPIKAPELELKPESKPNDGAEPQPKVETEGIK